ncbi:DgyrCDS14504 [Dimorphilus gyrociliatus]|uniref:DgyrCDS14504 n=1 Tax=Dimorphilus gyrociliatus TaxID=2664684 RepID=A0A7I8WE09_9ANNE|nr:DgyrCDS14504 [Dimorphilus gyrociliatus]
MTEREFEILFNWLRVCNNLNHLNLSDNSLNDSSMEQYRSLLEKKNLNKLKCLSLKKCMITKTGMNSLSKALSYLNDLRIIQLDNNDFGNDTLRNLYNGLKGCTQLEEISLKGSQLISFDFQLYKLFGNLKRVFACNNCFIDLSWIDPESFPNESTHFSMANIQMILPKSVINHILPKTLIHLNISGSDLDRWESGILEVISELTNLEYLKLKKCNLNKNSIETVKNTFVRLEKLKSLDFSNNNLGNESFLNSILTVLNEKKHFSELFVNGCCILDINFGDDSPIKLSTFDLSNNKLSETTVRNLANFWLEMNKLEKKVEFYMSNCVNHWNGLLQSCQLTNLLEIKNLAVLDISSNGIGKTNMEEILRKCYLNLTNLTEIYIYNNKLEGNILFKMIEYILNMKKLQVLNSSKHSKHYNFKMGEDYFKFSFLEFIDDIDKDIFNLYRLFEISMVIKNSVTSNILTITENRTPSKYLKYYLNILIFGKFQFSALNISQIVLDEQHLQLFSQISFLNNMLNSLSINEVTIRYTSQNRLNFGKNLKNLTLIRLLNIEFVPSENEQHFWDQILQNFTWNTNNCPGLNTLVISFGECNVSHHLSNIIKINRVSLTAICIENSTIGCRILRTIRKNCKNLLELSLWHSKINLIRGSDQTLLTNIFSFNQQLKYIELGHCTNIPHFNDTLQQIEKLEKLEKLGVRKQKFSIERLLNIIRVECQQLYMLDIAKCELGDKSINKFMRRIEEKNLFQMRQLTLRKNNLKRDGFDSDLLCKVLKRLCSLVIFSITENEIGDEHCLKILETLPITCKNLRMLYMSDCKLSLKNDTKLVNCIKKLQHLQVAVLNENKYEQTFCLVLESFNGKLSLTTLKLGSVTFSDGDWEYLQLKENHPSPPTRQSVKIILESFEKSFDRIFNLTHLDLSKNQFGDIIGKILFQQLSKNTKLLQILEFNDCQFTSLSIQYFINLLKCLKELKTLSISKNSYGNCGHEILSTLHAFCKNITNISMDNCNLEKSICYGIIEFSELPNKLKLVSLKDNPNLINFIPYLANIQFTIKYDNNDG